MRITVFKTGGNSAQGGFVSNGLTLQGPLILSGPHTEPLHAVPKQYIDNAAYNLDASNVTSGNLAAARLPAFNGDASTILGSSNILLSNTGITPGSVIKPQVDAKGRVIGSGTITESDITFVGFNKISVSRPTTLAGYGITGAVRTDIDYVMSGSLILNASPTDQTHAVNKQYLDTIAGQAGGISIGDIIRKPYTSTPTGFLKCNGAEVDKTTYANLYSVIGDTFTHLSSPGNGQPWRNQYDINNTQINDVLGWTAGTGLPTTLSHSMAVVTKNRVYLLGGYTGTAWISTVHTAPINPNGTLGTWTTAPSLPTTLGVSQAIVIKNRVYLIGGYNGTAYVSTVYTAPINVDGTIGAWTTSASLPSVLGYLKTVVIKNKIYTIGGWNGSSAISTIYTSTVNDDGSLTSWSVYGSLPYATFMCYVVVIKDRLYIIGGWNGSVSRSDVYYANIDSNGLIGSWISGVFLPKPMSYGDSFVSKNKVYIISTNEVWCSPINTDGSLGTWYKNSTIPSYTTAKAKTEAIITNSKVYLIGYTDGTCYNYVMSADFVGGLNDYSIYYGGDTTDANFVMPGSGQPWRQQYQINTTQSNDITGWVAEASLPGTLNQSQAIVTKNRVYLLGGETTNGTVATSVVYTAPINADGTLGTWTTGTSLPIAMYRSQAIVTKNRVYLLGGYNGTTSVSTVYTAPINADGTLGAWATGTSLPGTFSEAHAFITKNRVYLCGGMIGTTRSSAVYTAPINSDGTLGAWVTGTSLPDVLTWSPGVVTKNRVYLLGGLNATSKTTIVYTAVINADGTLGAWVTDNPLPIASHSAHVVSTKNRVYYFAGSVDSTGVSNAVYTAAINSDGTLGTWVAGTSLIATAYCSQTIITKNRVYILGGYNGTAATATVYSAPISSGLNDYSPYYDGTIQPVSADLNKFKLPDYTNSDRELGEYVTSYIKY